MANNVSPAGETAAKVEFRDFFIGEAMASSLVLVSVGTSNKRNLFGETAEAPPSSSSASVSTIYQADDLPSARPPPGAALPSYEEAVATTTDVDSQRPVDEGSSNGVASRAGSDTPEGKWERLPPSYWQAVDDEASGN